MAASKVVVVTGANRGIGRAICELILARPANPSLVLYATSRKGEDLRLPNTQHQTVYHALDVTSINSIATLLSTIKALEHAPISILINNAGVNLDDQFSPENAKKSLDVNYRGTLRACQAFLPLLAKDGRIVNLSSVGSSLDPWDNEMAERIRNISNLKDLEVFMQEYESAVEAGKDGDQGFPTQRAYSVSKACVNSFTGILAKENKELSINCCCPGWVNTDMGNQVGKPPKKPEEGARIPVRLAFGNLDGVSGKYWANDSIRSREEGKVQQW